MSHGVEFSFAEKIDVNKLEFKEVVGKGSFGVVRRARYRNLDVAVKLIETKAEQEAFQTELKQLSRVDHPNIVKLYGACTEPVCLVMEYAEGGSLYNVLHGEERISYSSAHAISWVLQCAKGVDYLHSMKPRPLIHRDLKPPNLLLIDGGTILKICDFGTACDRHTYMTNNKGSAAWMAPEVFEGTNYSEKCDVFSWGIILWEVLTRRKPFNEIGGAAFRIMWAIHSGKRPPAISNCPPIFNELMQQCWAKNSNDRPSMSEIHRIMSYISKFFPGADVPLQYTIDAKDDDSQAGTERSSVSSVSQTPQATQIPSGQVPEIVPVLPLSHPRTVMVKEDRQISAPASLSNSRESLDPRKRLSGDFSAMDVRGTSSQLSHEQKKALSHRRSGSYGASFAPAPPKSGPVYGHRRSGSHGSASYKKDAWQSDVMHHSSTTPDLRRDVDITSPVSLPPGNDSGGAQLAAWQFAVSVMDQQLQPLPPGTSDESKQIYKEHCKLAQEYLKLQTEIFILQQREHDLRKEVKSDSQMPNLHKNPFADEYSKLSSENVALKAWLNTLELQERDLLTKERESKQRTYQNA